MGDFGVDGIFTKGKNDNILLGSNFSIVEQKNIVKELITDGFPFFYGKITLVKKILLQDIDYIFTVNKRFHLINLKANGVRVGTIMFNNKLALKDYLNVGENIIELEVCIGLRNAYGPFHTEEQEDLIVSPYLFERPGEWIDGKSDKLRENYSFVKNFI